MKSTDNQSSVLCTLDKVDFCMVNMSEGERVIIPI
jgi:hypothetical protein